MSNTGIYPDRGIPLPGSDKDRRSCIKQEIGRLKWCLLLYKTDEWRTLFGYAGIDQEEAEGRTSALSASIS